MRFAIVAFAAACAAYSAHAWGQGSPVSLVIGSPQQAVALAFANAPALRSASASRQGVDADGLAAPLRPNPEASVTIENFGGIGGAGIYRGARSVETTLGVAQRLELGGKRTARIDLAERNSGVAGLEFEAAKLDLARDVVVALIDAEATSRAVRLEQDRARQSAETTRIALARVDAGREPLLQARRAEVAQTTANIAVEKARREAAVAVRNLATLVGVASVEMASRQPWYDDLGRTPPSPSHAGTSQRITANPDFQKADQLVAQQQANLRLQQANGVPDVTLQGSVRRFQEGRETAFVAGASIPLPFNDRNQAGVARAQADLIRAESEAKRARDTLANALVNAERGAESAWRTAQMLRQRALPAAEQSAKLAMSGFAEGKFTYLEASEAQRALSDARSQLNDVIREFHTRRAEVQRLIGLRSDGITGGASAQ
jgi:cobalt-zinc-cadmium efflux system outer membrane protein